MNQEELKKAIAAFAINDVYLREARTVLSEGFDPKFNQDPLDYQFKFSPKSSFVLSIKDDDGNEARIFRVNIETGLRLRIPKGTTSQEAIENAETDIDGIVAELITVFVAEYQIIAQETPSQVAQAEFAKNNAIFHVWPYWREYIHSTCARFSLPLITMPMFVLPQAQQEKKDL